MRVIRCVCERERERETERETERDRVLESPNICNWKKKKKKKFKIALDSKLCI